MPADRRRRSRGRPRPLPLPPRLRAGLPRDLPPSRSRPDPALEADAIRAGIRRQTRSRDHLRFEPQHGVDGVTRRTPLRDPGGEGELPCRRGSVVLPWRPAVARGAVRLDEPFTLEPPEQGVDRALADDRETPGAQTLRHLVAVGGPFLHHGQETQIKRPAQELGAAMLANCHAEQDTGHYHVSQATDEAPSGSSGPRRLPARPRTVAVP